MAQLSSLLHPPPDATRQKIREDVDVGGSEQSKPPTITYLPLSMQMGEQRNGV